MRKPPLPEELKDEKKVEGMRTRRGRTAWVENTAGAKAWGQAEHGTFGEEKCGGQGEHEEVGVRNCDPD